MNRTLRRPMFRMGGTAEGITSGLQPRQGYAGTGNTSDQRVSPFSSRNFNDFLIGMGLDLVSRPASGNIFQQVATSAKGPFEKFQQAKQIEDAYGMKETDEDRALVADLIKGMDDDKLSALMKDVKAGVESGLFADEKEGINQLLKKKIYGVQDMPGEAENERIRQLELMISRDQEVPTGMIKSVAQHIYKIETDAYPEDIQKDLNKTKTYIKPSHVAGTKKDNDGNVIEIVLDANYARTYSPGQIYYEPQTGELFKNVSKAGDAPRFVKVISE